MGPWRSTAKTVAAGLVGASVEFSWSVYETVLVPYLRSLRVSTKLVSLVWVLNPCFGIYLQPWIGSCSDRTRHRFRRRAYLIGLGAACLVANASVVGMPWVAGELDFSHTAMLAATIAMFAVYDLCNDTLLPISRVLAMDVGGAGAGDEEEGEGSHGPGQPGDGPRSAGSSADESEGAVNAIFTVEQIVGRGAAFVVGVFPVASAIGVFEGQHAFFRTMISLASVILLCCLLIAVVVCQEEPVAAPQPGRAVHSLPPLAGRDAPVDLGHTAPEGQQPAGSVNRPLPGPDPPAGASWLSMFDRRRRVGLALLLLVQTGGWIAICSESFFWTSWLGLHKTFPGTELKVAFVSLLAESASSLVFSLAISTVNRRVGVKPLWYAAFLVACGSLMCAPIATPAWAPAVIGAALGVHYVSHQTNGILLVTRMVPEPRLRASAVSLVCATMPVAQLLVGGISGLIVSASDTDFARYYFYVGAFCGALTAAAAAADWLAGNAIAATGAAPAPVPRRHPRHRRAGRGETEPLLGRTPSALEAAKSR